MKIVSEDAGELVASDRDVKGLIFGVVFVLIGVGIIAGVHQLVGVLIGAALALAGAAAVLFRKVRTLSVNKGTGQVTFTMKSLIKHATKTFAVADIAKVQFTEQYSTSFNTAGQGGGSSTSQLTKVLLVAKNGEEIDLADGQRSMQSFGIFGKAPNQATGQKVADFLGVPFEQIGPPSIGQVTNSIVGAFKGPQQAPSVVPVAPVSLPTQPPPPAVPTTPAAPSTSQSPNPPDQETH